MRQIKKFIITSLVLAGIAIGGIKGFLWYKIKTTADEVIVMLAPQATITYDGVITGLDGTLGISEVRIRPQGFAEEVYIEEISFKLDNLVSLIELEQQAKQQKLPNAIAFNLLGFSMNMQGELAKTLYGGGEGSQFFMNSPASHACGDVGLLGAPELRSMGYSGLLVQDIVVGYRHNEFNRLLDLYMDATVREMETWRFLFQVKATSMDLMPVMAAMQSQQFEKIQITLEDMGYQTKLYEFCRRQEGLSEQDYLVRNTELMKENLGKDFMMAFSDSMYQALNDFYRNGGEMTWEVDPPREVDWGNLMLYKPEDIATILGLSLQVNGKAYEDLAIGFGVDVIEEEQEMAEQPVMPVAPPPVEEESEPEWRVFSLNEIDKHRGRLVKVKTRTGKTRQGQLQQILETGIRLTLQSGANKLTYTIEFNHIEEISAFY